MGVRRPAADFVLTLFGGAGEPEILRHVAEDGEREDPEDGVRRSERGGEGEDERQDALRGEEGVGGAGGAEAGCSKTTVELLILAEAEAGAEGLGDGEQALTQAVFGGSWRVRSRPGVRLLATTSRSPAPSLSRAAEQRGCEHQRERAEKEEGDGKDEKGIHMIRPRSRSRFCGW